MNSVFPYKPVFKRKEKVPAKRKERNGLL